MYFKTFIMILLFFVNTFSYAIEGATDEKIIKIATLPDYAPFCFADKQHLAFQSIKPGKNGIGFYGFSWDIVRESFHEMGYTIELSIMPWSRSMASFKRGDQDILFPVSKNKQRKKIFNYSVSSIGSAKISIYVLSESPIVWKNLSSLNDLTIGVKRGFNYGNEWNENQGINKHHVATILQGFKMLKLNRFNGFICYEFSCDYMLRQNGWGTIYKKLPSIDLLEDYLVSLKSNPNGVNILKDFDTGFSRLVQNGEYEKIKSKWFGN